MSGLTGAEARFQGGEERRLRHGTFQGLVVLEMGVAQSGPVIAQDASSPDDPLTDTHIRLSVIIRELVGAQCEVELPTPEVILVLGVKVVVDQCEGIH